MRSASPTSSGVTSSASTQKTSPHGSTSTAGLSALLAECHGAAVSAHGFGSLGKGAVVIQISRAPASKGRGLVQVLSSPSPVALARVCVVVPVQANARAALDGHTGGAAGRPKKH